MHHQLSEAARRSRHTGSFSRAGSAAAARPPGSSTSVASPGSPATLPGPGVQRPRWDRNPHNAGAGAPESSARSGPPACGSMAGRAVREPGSNLRRSRRRNSIRRTWRSVTFSRRRLPTAAAASARTSCNTFNRSRSRCAQSDSLRFHGPSAIHESGHFYFAQTGHSHFAATSRLTAVDLPSTTT